MLRTWSRRGERDAQGVYRATNTARPFEPRSTATVALCRNGARALSLPAGERRYICERGRYDGQLVGSGDGGFDIFDGRGLFDGKGVPRGGGLYLFDVRGVYARTGKGAALRSSWWRAAWTSSEPLAVRW